MWWYWEFIEQTEEWYEVPSTGKGKAMPQHGVVTEDDTRGHTVGWRRVFLSLVCPKMTRSARPYGNSDT